MEIVLTHLVYGNTTQFILMGILLCLSAFFSGSETAIFSLTTTDLNNLRNRNTAASGAILTLHRSLRRFLFTVLFCNMTVNILFFSTSAVVASHLVDQGHTMGSIIFSLLCLLTIITFGEVTPKALAIPGRMPFSIIASIPLLGLHRLLAHPLRIMGGIVKLVERLVGVEANSPRLADAELRMLVDLSRSEGVISSNEQELIEGVIELPTVRMKEIMTPRVDLVWVNGDASAKELICLARVSGHSKIMVRDQESDEFFGWVDSRRVFVEDPDGSISNFILPPLYVSELDRADQVFAVFGKTRAPLAIVVDERGTATGMVTWSDVMAEIFGDFDNDEPEEAITEERENIYVLGGRVSVREWRDLFSVAEELPQCATVSGLVTALLGRSPIVGDIVTLSNLKMEVLSVQRRRIARIRLTLDENGGDR